MPKPFEERAVGGNPPQSLRHSFGDLSKLTDIIHNRPEQRQALFLVP